MVFLGSYLKGGFVFKMREWGNGVSEKKEVLFAHSYENDFQEPF